MPQRYKVPSTNALMSRILLECLALLILGYPMLHIYVILQGDVEPYKRGFFCDDESLKHPDIPEEISVGACVIIWVCIVIFFVPLVELLHVAVYRYPEWERQVSEQRPNEKWHCLSRVPLVIVELYRMLGYFFVGALGALLTTEMAKYRIGRLRPYFLTVCNISLTDDLCKDEFGYNKFVTDYHCDSRNSYEVREARKSFLSGHSSFSFYCSVFLIIYLQARLSRRQHRHCQKRSEPKTRVFVAILRALKVLRPFFQFGFFALALFIAFTRISDYKHHATDIIAGIAVGVVFALIILLFLVDLFKRPRSFEENVEDSDILGLHMESLLDANNRSLPSPTHALDVENNTSYSEADVARHARHATRPATARTTTELPSPTRPSSSRHNSSVQRVTARIR